MARFKNRWNFFVKNSNLVNIKFDFPAQNHILIYSINLIPLKIFIIHEVYSWNYIDPGVIFQMKTTVQWAVVFP